MKKKYLIILSTVIGIVIVALIFRFADIGQIFFQAKEIGFLGAGTIIRSKEGIRGLTTAASIWVSAAIGLAVGCGYFSAAIIVTGASYLALSLLKKLEKEVV